MDDLLQQGVAAYKAGKREEARKIFIAVVKQSLESERSWGWMYQTSNNDKERIYCLKQILRINPKNEKVNQLLGQLLTPSPSPISTASIQANPPSIATKKCPYCEESNRAEAQRCKYCGRDISEKKDIPVRRDVKNKTNLTGPIIGMVTLIIICGLIYGLSRGVEKVVDAIPTPTRSPQENAWYACTLFVEKQLKAAAFDAQSYNSDGVVLLDNGQYRVDIHYAKLTTTYTCVVSDRMGGKWELISLVATRD